MKKLPLLLSFILALVFVSPILAASLYSSDISVVDTSSSDRTGVPVLVPFGSSQAVDLGYLNANGLDTRMFEGTTEQGYMVADNKLGILTPALVADQERMYRFETGYTPANTSFGVIPGTGGYVTIPDAAAIELGNNFEVEQKGYVDTSAGANKDLVYRPATTRTYVSAEGEITSAILEDSGTTWVLPTGHELPGGGWTDPQKAYDNDIATLAYAPTLPASVFTEWFVITHSSIPCNKIWVYYGAGAWNNYACIDIYYEGDWHYLTSLSNKSNEEIPITPSRNITKARYKSFSGSDSHEARILEFQFGEVVDSEVVSVTVTGLSDGEYIVKTTADGTDLTLSVTDYAGTPQGNSPQSIALGGASVPDNANSYTIMQSSTLPYLEYMKISTDTGGGMTERLWYQPNTIILGTNLPDRTGTNHGTITWGTNSSLTVSAGGLTSSTDYVPGGSDGDGPPTVLPLPGALDMWGETPDVSIDWLPPSLIDPAAFELGWDRNTLYSVLLIFAAIGLGVGVAIATGSPLLAVVAVGIGLVIGASTGATGWWVVIVYAIFGSTYLVASKSI